MILIVPVTFKKIIIDYDQQIRHSKVRQLFS